MVYDSFIGCLPVRSTQCQSLEKIRKFLFLHTVWYASSICSAAKLYMFGSKTRVQRALNIAPIYTNVSIDVHGVVKMVRNGEAYILVNDDLYRVPVSRVFRSK